MTSPLPSNTSQFARLLLGAPEFRVGWQEPVYLDNPAAGTEWVHTVPGRFYERVLSVRYVLTTSAVVANRTARVALADEDGTHILAVPATGTVVAGSAVTVHLTAGGPAFAAGSAGVSDGYLPDLLIPPGWYWHANTGGLDAGDTETGIRLLVQRFPSDAVAAGAGG